MLFFIENSTKMGAYFRTLYRIYDLIDSSSINEKIKKNYLKIMRAQLTESELFFVRYNAMTYYGYNFIYYINKYHILKHLPAYKFQINITKEHDVNLILEINKSEINRCMEYRALDKYDNKKIQQLLDCFIKEIFLYSNFERFNATEDIETYSSQILSKDGITYINSGIRNKNERSLKLWYMHS